MAMRERERERERERKKESTRNDKNSFFSIISFPAISFTLETIARMILFVANVFGRTMPVLTLPLDEARGIELGWEGMLTSVGEAVTHASARGVPWNGSLILLLRQKKKKSMHPPSATLDRVPRMRT